MDRAEQSLYTDFVLWKFVWNCLWVVSSYEWGVARQPDTLQISFPALITSVLGVYTIATHSFESLYASIISGRVCILSWDCIAIDRSHWGRGVDISPGVSDRSLALIRPHNPDHNTQYKSNTCRILSNKSPVRDFYRFFSISNMDLAVLELLDLLSPLPEYDKCWKPLSQFPPRRI